MGIFKKKKVKKDYYELILKNSVVSNYYDSVEFPPVLGGIPLYKEEQKSIVIFMINGVQVLAVEKSAIKKLVHVIPHTCDCEACKFDGNKKDKII